MRLAAITLAFTGFVFSIASAPAAPLRATDPPPPHIVLVELFTSEGCSSCPPADALLRKIDGYRTSSNQLIVGISEHVTYWNQLGWADPFSDETYTARQDGYAGRFHLDSVYTPQAVVNGDKQFNGGDGPAILRAVQSAEPSAVRVHIDSATVADNKIALTGSISGVTGLVDLYAVIADDMATSSVLRGENSGRTLKHVAVARTMKKLGTLKADTSMTVSLPSPPLIPGQPATGRHLILFAQMHDQGKVLAIESKEL